MVKLFHCFIAGAGYLPASGGKPAIPLFGVAHFSARRFSRGRKVRYSTTKWRAFLGAQTGLDKRPFIGDNIY